MGDIPAFDKNTVTSAIIINPKPGDIVEPNQDLEIQARIAGIDLGIFTNPANTYYSAPQQLNGNGQIIGHTHITCQDLGDSLAPTQPLDGTKFVFFKGFNQEANGNGVASVQIPGGLPAGNYRCCTMSSAGNHQPVLMALAQRGAQDDCTKFVVAAGGQAGAGNGNNNNDEDNNNNNAGDAGGNNQQDNNDADGVIGNNQGNQADNQDGAQVGNNQENQAGNQDGAQAGNNQGNDADATGAGGNNQGDQADNQGDVQTGNNLGDNSDAAGADDNNQSDNQAGTGGAGAGTQNGDEAENNQLNQGGTGTATGDNDQAAENNQGQNEDAVGGIGGILAGTGADQANNQDTTETPAQTDGSSDRNRTSSRRRRSGDRQSRRRQQKRDVNGTEPCTNSTAADAMSSINATEAGQQAEGEMIRAERTTRGRYNHWHRRRAEFTAEDFQN